MRKLSSLALTVLLAACATSQVQTAAQVSEKIDTEAADIYVAIATYENQDESTNPGNTNKDEAFKLKAWQDFSLVHTAYLSGQVLTTAVLSTLTADQAAVKGQ
jgi:hypothetical protein